MQPRRFESNIPGEDESKDQLPVLQKSTSKSPLHSQRAPSPLSGNKGSIKADWKDNFNGEFIRQLQLPQQKLQNAKIVKKSKMSP